MIVEFTGPAGAGKSSYASRLLDLMDIEGYRSCAIHGNPKYRCTLMPRAFSDLDAQNWRTDLSSLPWLMLFAFKHPRFLLFALKRIIAAPEGFREKLAITRSFIRKAGIYRFLTQRRFCRLYIAVDEGLFHSAHNFLVAVSGSASDEQVVRFADLVPLPDLLVFVTACPETLATRLRQRGNLSPRIRNDMDTERFTANAWSVFETLIRNRRLADRVIVIDSDHEDFDSASHRVIAALQKLSASQGIAANE